MLGSFHNMYTNQFIKVQDKGSSSEFEMWQISICKREMSPSLTNHLPIFVGKINLWGQKKSIVSLSFQMYRRGAVSKT